MGKNFTISSRKDWQYYKKSLELQDETQKAYFWKEDQRCSELQYPIGHWNRKFTHQNHQVQQWSSIVGESRGHAIKFELRIEEMFEEFLPFAGKDWRRTRRVVDEWSLGTRIPRMISRVMHVEYEILKNEYHLFEI